MQRHVPSLFMLRPELCERALLCVDPAMGNLDPENVTQGTYLPDSGQTVSLHTVASAPPTGAPNSSSDRSPFSRNVLFKCEVRRTTCGVVRRLCSHLAKLASKPVERKLPRMVLKITRLSSSDMSTYPITLKCRTNRGVT